MTFEFRSPNELARNLPAALVGVSDKYRLENLTCSRFSFSYKSRNDLFAPANGEINRLMRPDLPTGYPGMVGNLTGNFIVLGSELPAVAKAFTSWSDCNSLRAILSEKLRVHTITGSLSHCRTISPTEWVAQIKLTVQVFMDDFKSFHDSCAASVLFSIPDGSTDLADVLNQHNP